MGPPWFRLLDRYRRDGHFGLTPSFLIGALRAPVGAVSDEATSLAEFQMLLRAMRDETPSGSYVRIAECPRLDQAVAAVLSGTPPDQSSGSGEQVLPRPGSESRLYAWPQYFAQESRDVGSLSTALWAIFGTPIRGGRFSYRNGAFGSFDADDLEFIRRAMQQDDAQ